MQLDTFKIANLYKVEAFLKSDHPSQNPMLACQRLPTSKSIMEPNTSTIGEIRLFAGNFAPAGWAICNGQLLQIQDNQALYSILGTLYGGDGRTTFGLPKIKPVDTPDGDPYNNINYIICLHGMYPRRW
jgi:microcystin-dependent protein